MKRGAPAADGVREREVAVERSRSETVEHLERFAAQGDDVQRGVLHEPQDEAVRTEPGQAARTGERGRHVVHGHRARHRTRCAFNDIRLALPPFFQIEDEGRMGDLRRRVPDDPHDPVGPPVPRPQDARLDVGPLRGAVVERHGEVDAVGVAAAGDGLVDRDVEPGPFRGLQVLQQAARPRVVRRRIHAEHHQPGFVDVQGPGVQIPVEAAGPVHGEAFRRPDLPVVPPVELGERRGFGVPRPSVVGHSSSGDRPVGPCLGAPRRPQLSSRDHRNATGPAPRSRAP